MIETTESASIVDEEIISIYFLATLSYNVPQHRSSKRNRRDEEEEEEEEEREIERVTNSREDVYLFFSRVSFH
jgi:shikimate kinase